MKISKEILTLIFLVLLFLVLVSWTSTRKEAFSNQKKKYILDNYSQQLKKWASEHSSQVDSQKDQDSRLENIGRKINELENKMEKLRNNYIVDKSGKTKVDTPCAPGDPLCFMKEKSKYKFSSDHFSEKLS